MSHETNADTRPEKRNFNPLRLFRMLGPAVIIAASIIGPGTVTTASKTGASYGYILLWCMALTPLLAYIFEEPAVRWTLKTNTTMLEGIRTLISPIMAKLTFIALLMGALAYQTGNYLGAAMAINYLLPGLSIQNAMIILAAASCIIAFIGKYKVIEEVNMVLILIMLASFLITMFASRPSLAGIAAGFVPRIPKGAELLALGLVGTTMCPDVPFALSSLTKRKWQGGVKDLRPAKGDLKLNMIITAVIGCAIMVCSATVLKPAGIEVTSAADMAVQLTPVLGQFAGVLFSLGLWAAGFSSGIYMTSCIPPMMNEAFGLKQDDLGKSTRICLIIIGVFPVLVSFLFGSVPVTVIVAAQVLNAMILPLSVILITFLANRRDQMGEFVSSKRQNWAMGLVALVVALVTITGLPSIVSAITGLF